ncbi:MAG: response regulator [Sphingobium sp.]
MLRSTDAGDKGSPAIPSAPPTIALIEDDDAVRRSMQLLLQGQGFLVRSFADAGPLLGGGEIAADCLVSDYRLRGSDGVAVLAALRAKGWRGPAIMVTAFGDGEVAQRALAAGFVEILDKPLRNRALTDAVSRALAGAGRAGG